METTAMHTPSFNRETPKELYELNLAADIDTPGKAGQLARGGMSLAGNTADQYTGMERNC